ncbi:MAG: hypothetical protein HKN09_03290 [Saprospiraceae bacterium]|nr:hypothetical protein [Saprospiraceae bacterium]
MKKLIILFVIVASCIVKDANQKEKQVECIHNILEQDSLLGSLRNHACEVISLEATILNYTDSLLALDYSNCPNAFTLAFKSHILAWQKLIPEVEAYDSLRGEMHELFDVITAEDIDSSFTLGIKEIWSTWDSVEYYKSKFD